MLRARRNLRPARAFAIATVVLALAALVTPLPAGAIERWYSRGLYIHIQRVLTPLTNLVPVALLDVAAAALLVIGVRGIARVARSAGVRAAATVVAVRLPVFGAAVYLLFLLVWGLNYRRVPLERKLEFDDSGVTTAAARLLASESVRIVNETFDRSRSAFDPAALSRGFSDAQRVLGAERVARPGIPKRSLLGLYFRWAAIDGMTNPFFLEIIVNPDVLDVERPFVMAHEWAHLAGYADESEANFVAWLSCARGDAQSRYSGWLAIYTHVSNALPPPERGAFADMLGAGPRRDLLAINARLLRSAPIVRHAARDVYDSYLRANRVERGIGSYEAVVRLVLGVQFDEGWRPRLRQEGQAEAVGSGSELQSGSGRHPAAGGPRPEARSLKPEA